MAMLLGVPSGAVFGAWCTNWLYMRVSDLLLASTATPLPVSFQKPVPVTVHTPVHVTMPTPVRVTFPTPVAVHTVGGPPDWLIWWGFGISIAALVVAVITLAGVGVQIYFARQQIELANEQIQLATDQIDLANKELKAVETDLENQREQMREFRRRPDLRLAFANMVETLALATPQRINLPFDLMNYGTRATTECRVRMLFPETADTGSGSWENKGTKYRAHEVLVQTRLYPANKTSLQVDNVRCAESFEILWEIDDEFGHYPATGFGKLQIEVAKSS